MVRSLFQIFIMSAVPLTEQRLAIPVGIIGYHLNPMSVFVASFLGSLLPVPFVLLFFNTIFNWMKNYKIFDKFVLFIENKIRKNTGKMEKYKELGLIAFIAVPLPTTGIWTGSAIAAFLGFDVKKSFLCAALGGIISAIIITVLSVFFPAILSVLKISF
ncbi:ligand-binding protein SH3 [Clostridium niameyense]|uniref:Ligand-binding protein SH3 n=1 Tax=Clostridium niameyense TaxID=1622073 RepID=A0A6M0RB03_9CLOT|nr:small multi-drug export protein [Clostridium niameyense]NEZ47465.1 ligand-binding protein SH3 [Clostridium niameyense]